MGRADIVLSSPEWGGARALRGGGAEGGLAMGS